MHALRKYLRDGMDARGWQQADLVRASGLRRQRVSQMLSDDRDVLPSVPKRDTLQAIARAFQVRESTVTAVAFEAMGYDLAAVRREADLSTASTEEIVRTLAARLGVGIDAEDGEGRGQQPAPNTRAGDARDEELLAGADGDSAAGERANTHTADESSDRLDRLRSRRARELRARISGNPPVPDEDTPMPDDVAADVAERPNDDL